MGADAQNFFLAFRGMGSNMVGMKTYGIAIMAALAMAGVCMGAPGSKKGAKKADLSDLGSVTFIGDSITHGYDSPSYRWALHKILVDNGIEFDVVGVETGNRNEEQGGVKPGALYIGKTFNNRHCAMSSQRAYETSGRDHTKASGRLDNTDILDWLKLDETYTGPRKIDGDAPDTYFILLGTNDLLSEYGKDGVAKHIQEAEKALLDRKKGDMSVIVDSIRKANKRARIVVLNIPTWGNNQYNTTAKDYAAVIDGYNKRFAQWAKNKKVILADVNKGIIDVADVEKPGKGVPSFYGKDGLHPNVHGDMLIAGCVARALGIAGRSAGLPRKSTEEFSVPMGTLVETATEKEGVEAGEKTLTVAPGKKLVAPWPAGSDLTKGFSVALTIAVGDGAKDGWETDQGLEVQVGSGAAVSGTLTVTESYLKWGKTILYSADMSQNKEPLRVVWTPGNPDYGVNRGFYVWLGDMLVGEGLPSDKAGVNGVGISNTGKAPVTVRQAAAEPTAVAPSAKGYIKEEVTIAPKL